MKSLGHEPFCASYKETCLVEEQHDLLIVLMKYFDFGMGTEDVVGAA